MVGVASGSTHPTRLVYIAGILAGVLAFSLGMLLAMFRDLAVPRRPVF